jgi:DNA-binding NarL/FixJ family response regulator
VNKSCMRPASHRKPRLLIAEDNELFASTIKRVVAPYFDVVGLCANGVDAVRYALELQPDIVLMDVVMPVLDGIQATRQLRALDKHTKIVMVSGLEDPQFVKAALQAGAQQYVFKRRISTDLVAAINAAVFGQGPLSITDQLAAVGDWQR